MKSVESVGFWCRAHRGSKFDVCMLEAASPVARSCTHGGRLPQPRVRRYLRPFRNERGRGHAKVRQSGNYPGGPAPDKLL